MLVNDFGQVNIDAALVASVAGEPVSLANGCICCSMRGGLIDSTLRLLGTDPPPEYLIVEASGISDPIGVAGAFRTSVLREQVRLDSVVTLVDAEQVTDPRLDRQLIELQIQAADIIILNKIDLAGEVQVREVRNLIGSLAPAARVLPAVQAHVPLQLLLGISANSPLRADLATHRHLEHDYESWTYRSTRPLAYRRLRAALESLPAGIFRAKGFVRLADAPNLRFVAQMVGKRAALEVERPWEGAAATELVFVGRLGELSPPALERRLDACSTDAVPLLDAAGMQRLRARAAPITRREPVPASNSVRA